MKTWLLLSALLFTLNAEAHSSAPPEACDPDVYKGRFYDTIPRYGEIHQTLELLEKGDANELRCLEAFLQTPEGKELVSKGRLAQLLYGAYLERDFDASADRKMVLTPIHEIRARLFGLIEKGKTRPGETKPKPWEVRAQALSETLTRFSLPATTNAADLEQLGRSDPKHYPALDFFRRREHRLMEQMTSRGPTIDRSPEKFKAQMVEKLTELRVRNFLSALRASEELANEKIKLQARADKKSQVLTIAELSKFQISFLSTRNLVPTHVVAETPKKIPQTRTSAFIGKYLDKVGEEIYIFKPRAENQIQNLTFILTAPDGSTLSLSETEYNKILFALLPRLLAHQFNESRSTHRYRLESLARDYHLARAAQLLRGRTDRTIEELYSRLSTWIKNERRQTGEAFLTDLIATRGPKATSEDPVSHLLWWGWSQHPRHWEVRGETSWRMKLPSSKTEDPHTHRKSLDRDRRKEAAAEKERQSYRYGTEQTRRQVVKRKTSKWTAMALGAFAASYLVYTQDAPTLQLPNFTMPEISLPKIQVPLDWDMSFLPKLLGGGNRDQMNFDDYPKFDNYRIDPPKNQDGSKRGENSKHDPTTSAYAIEILKLAPYAPRPQFYNFGTVSHLPKPLQTAAGDDLDGLFTRRLYINRVADPEEPDLVVDVNLRGYSLEKRLGVLQMANYKIIGLDLYDGWGRAVSQRDFDVFEIAGNRQTYAKLSPNVTWGPYSYRASYKIDDRYAKDAFNPTLNFSTLQQINGRLLSSGFTTLSAHISSQVKSGEGVRFTDFSQMFQAGATYTFSNQKWSINTKADPAFKPFTKFLNDGHLHYQCTGSNIFFQTALNEAVKIQPDLAGIQAQHLVGYAGGDGDGILKGSPSHLHTVAFRLQGDGEQHIELDATPEGAIPAPASQKKKPSPTPPTQDESPWRAILPQRPKYYVPEERLEKQDDVKEEAETPTSAPPAEKPKVTRNHEEIERILRMLTSLRSETVEAFKPVYETEAWLARQNFLSIPGVRLIVLSNYLLDGFKDKSSPERLQLRLQQSAAADAEAALNQLFKTEWAGLNKSLTNLDQWTENDKYAAYSFLLQDPLRSRLRELSQFLGSYEWGSLLREYAQFHQQNPCEKALQTP